jgi:hypothetical protein
MVIEWPMFSVPNPPSVIALISPPMKVLLYAPAKVLHGAVKLQGSMSFPVPDTHVRVACPNAGAALTPKASTPKSTASLLIR